MSNLTPSQELFAYIEDNREDLKSKTYEDVLKLIGKLESKTFVKIRVILYQFFSHCYRDGRPTLLRRIKYKKIFVLNEDIELLEKRRRFRFNDAGEIRTLYNHLISDDMDTDEGDFSLISEEYVFLNVVEDEEENTTD